MGSGAGSLQPGQAAARPLRARPSRARCSGIPRSPRTTPRLRAVRPALASSRPRRSTGATTGRPATAAGRLGHVRAARQGLHEAASRRPRGAARHLRRPRAPGGDRRTCCDLGVTAVELLPVHQFVHDRALVGARAAQLLGLPVDRLLRAPRRAYAAGGPRSPEFKAMVQALHAAGPRGHPRRRLQPHRRGRRATARRCASAAWTTPPTTACRRPAPLRRRHRLRQHARRAPPHGRCGSSWTRCATGRGDARRRVPLRPRGRARARRQRLRPARPRSCRRSARTRCWPRSSSSPSPGTSAGGYEVGDFPAGWSEWNGRYRDTVRDFWRGTEGTLADFATRARGLRGPLRRRRPAPDGVDQPRHRPRRVHARRPRQLRRQAQRGQRRGQPRRHRRQPQLELRRRGADRRP